MGTVTEKLPEVELKMYKTKVKGILVEKVGVENVWILKHNHERRMICPNFVICLDFTALRMLSFLQL